MPALQLYGYNGTSSTLTNAFPMTTSVGSPTTGTQFCNIDASLGWGELTSKGTTSAWSAYNGPAYPTGNGIILDANTLDNQLLTGGLWTFTLFPHLNTGNVAITADILVRVFSWQVGNSGYVYLGSALNPGQSITVAGASMSFTGAIPPQRLGVGDRLYFDIWANITVNPNAPGAQIGQTLPTTATGSATLFNVATAGYQGQTQAQLLTNYSFGGFNLNDGSNYILVDKQQDTVQVKQTYIKPARYDGVKKVGEAINERVLGVKLRVIADSRANLENKLGALRTAMSFRQQRLTLHSNDARYYTADCTDMKVQFKSPVSAIASLAFVAQNPYAYSPFTTSFTDSGLATLVSGNTYQRTSISLYNYGEANAFPTVVITNNTPYNNFTLNQTATNGTPFTSLTVTAAAQNIPSGASLFISQGGNTSTLVLSAAYTAGATTISIVSWTPTATYTAGASIVQYTHITAVTLTNATDGRTITFSGLSPVLLGGQFFTIVCAPTGTSGYTGILNGSGTPLTFSGIFPMLEAGATSWTVQVTMLGANIAPTLQTVWTWTPTWLA